MASSTPATEENMASSATKTAYKAVCSDHAHPRGGEFVVLATTYPTTYGANRGRKYTKAQLCRESDMEVYGPQDRIHSDRGTADDPEKPAFRTFEEALDYAKFFRDNNAWFTDYEYEEAANRGYKWCSAEMKNYDNDEELIVEVISKTDFALKLQQNMKLMGYK